MIESRNPLTIIITGPTQNHNFYKLVTAGMRHQDMDENQEVYGFELVLCLPLTWHAPKDEADIVNLSDQDKWPILLLLKLAEFPQKHRTSLGIGHTVPLGGTFKEFTHVMLHHTFLDENFDLMVEKGADPLLFLGVYPITPAELDFKKKNDADELVDLLLSNNIAPVFDLEKERHIK